MTASVEEPERRVVALERANTPNVETLKWVAGTLGHVKATQDEHTVRLDRIETVQDKHTKRPERVESEVRGLRSDFAGYRAEFPGIVANALRGVLKKS